jgi:tRNA threonylcarbamoyladenosine modification (KEOPS) complex Cgi121 subunit
MPYSYPITHSDLFVTVTGADNVHISDVNLTLNELDKITAGKSYQLFDAEKIVSVNQIYYAAANAYYAFKYGYNISNKLEVETLLYVSTQNQIAKAIKLVGVSKLTKRIAILVISETSNDQLSQKIANYLGELKAHILEMTPSKYEKLKELYGIKEEAVRAVGVDRYEALSSLVSEKSTLISLRR